MQNSIFEHMNTNYVCTWFCADEVGEESNFPQTGELSSSRKHQEIYWRCILSFYMTSKCFNTDEQHLFFTNVSNLPVVDGISVAAVLENLQVQVCHTDFKFKTPQGYYGSWQNQFYEFSIMEYISNETLFPENANFLILDSDCIFLKAADPLFQSANRNGGFLSYTLEYAPDHIINGITREEMRVIYGQLSGTDQPSLPDYHGGEFLLSSKKNIVRMFSQFSQLWPEMLRRNEEGKLKFNEEAHVLSYLYYRNGFSGGGANTFIKRIWTNPVFFRNVAEADKLLTIWHLPAEKTLGLASLYRYFARHQFDPRLISKNYSEVIAQKVGIPRLSVQSYLSYYSQTYQNALKKKVRKLVKSLNQS